MSAKKAAQPDTRPERADRDMLVMALRKIERCIGELSWLSEVADGAEVEPHELRRVRDRLAKAAHELDVGTPRLRAAGK